MIGSGGWEWEMLYNEGEQYDNAMAISIIMGYSQGILLDISKSSFVSKMKRRC